MKTLAEFSEAGVERFRSLLVEGKATVQAVRELVRDGSLTRSLDLPPLDESRIFASRFEFGLYLSHQLEAVGTRDLFQQRYDGMWAWVAGLYFEQLASNGIRRFEHYIPTRDGTAGSILHRQAPRTAVELVRSHGENARFALQQDMGTQGQLLESLTASQSVARSKPFFGVASKLYADASGKIRRGANAKPKKHRAPGETTGMGSIRRLPVVLRRLDLTFDVDQLGASELVALLPREFGHWTKAQTKN